MLDENRCTRKPKLLLVAKSLTISITANAPLALSYDHSDVSTPLGLFFGPLGLFLWLGSGSKTFLEITYVDKELPIFSLLIQPNLWPFGTFGAIQSYFWG